MDDPNIPAIQLNLALWTFQIQLNIPLWTIQGPDSAQELGGSRLQETRTGNDDKQQD